MISFARAYSQAFDFKTSHVTGQKSYKDFDYDIVNCPFVDGDIPRSTSFGVCTSNLRRFARESGLVRDFDDRNSRAELPVS